MEKSAGDSYLTTQVMTATPQKLHLMLIDGAIRFAEQAGDLWRDGKDEQASDAIIRSQQILTELIGGLDREQSFDVVGKVAAIYVFIHRSLVEAHLRRDETKLSDALAVLKTEQQTWRQVCTKLAESLGETEPLASRAHGVSRTPTHPATGSTGGEDQHVERCEFEA